MHIAAAKSKGRISVLMVFHAGEPSKDFAQWYFTNAPSIFKYSISKTKIYLYISQVFYSQVFYYYAHRYAT